MIKQIPCKVAKELAGILVCVSAGISLIFSKEFPECLIQESFFWLLSGDQAESFGAASQLLVHDVSVHTWVALWVRRCPSFYSQLPACGKARMGGWQKSVGLRVL